MIRVLLVDDHPVIREGLKGIFARTCDIRVAGEAGGGAEALQVWRELRPDVVLLDLEMPDMPGRNVLRTMREENSEVRVIILSINMDEIYAERLMNAGAGAYLEKDCLPEQLVEAVRRVHQVGAFFTPEQMRRALDRLHRGRPALAFDRLSERELEVLTLFSQGLSTNQMADHLGVTAQSISTYKSRAASKLDLAETSQLVLVCEALREFLRGR